jgi:hypothetical protein
MGAPAAGVCVCEALPINLFLASFAEWKNGTQRFGCGWCFTFGRNRGKRRRVFQERLTFTARSKCCRARWPPSRRSGCASSGLRYSGEQLRSQRAEAWKNAIRGSITIIGRVRPAAILSIRTGENRFTRRVTIIVTKRKKPHTSASLSEISRSKTAKIRTTQSFISISATRDLAVVDKISNCIDEVFRSDPQSEVPGEGR